MIDSRPERRAGEGETYMTCKVATNLNSQYGGNYGKACLIVPKNSTREQRVAAARGWAKSQLGACTVYYGDEMLVDRFD